MNVCRNISSGRIFIYIKEIDWDRIQLITPHNQIKILERHLFEDEIEGTENNFLERGLISTKQVKAYQNYKMHIEDEHLEFDTENSQPQAHKKAEGKAMKTIEIDDEVYAYLQNDAISFEEPTPNHVIRRIIGLERMRPPQETIKKVARSSNGSKSPKADLVELEQYGIIQEGQKFFLNYKGKKLSKVYETQFSGNGFIYEGNKYKMSKLVADILEKEGLGIPSKSYRGPEYWCNSDGISVRQLWEKHLQSQKSKI